MQVGLSAGDRWRLVMGHALIRTPFSLGRHVSNASDAYFGFGFVEVGFRCGFIS
jgi:hypothetical protein